MDARRQEAADVGPDRVRAVDDQVAGVAVVLDRVGDLERLGPAPQRVARATPEPADEQEHDHRVPDRPAREHRDAEPGHEQEEGEHHRRIATLERGRGRPGEQQPEPERDETEPRLDAHAGPGPQVDVDVARIDRSREDREQEEEEQRPPDDVRVAAEGLHRLGGTAHRADHCTPRRAGVDLLVAEGRQPGDERERTDEQRADRAPRRPPSLERTPNREVGHPQPDHRQQCERPVVRVEQQPGDDRDAREPAPRRAVEHPHEREVAEEDQQHHQRVHAGLGRIADREGRGGEQQHRGPGDRSGRGVRHTCTSPAPVEPAAGEPRGHERRDPEDAGERPHRLVAGPEGPHPEVQQQVMEGRRAVLLQGAAQLGQREPGDVDREHLVRPEVRAGEEPQPDADDDDRGNGEDQPDRVVPGPRRAGRSPRVVGGPAGPERVARPHETATQRVRTHSHRVILGGYDGFVATHRGQGRDRCGAAARAASAYAVSTPAR